MKGRPIILTTDFGQADEYVGVLKGVILTINPEATLIDLCHAIPPQDIDRAAQVIGRNYRFFPNDSLHLCIVDPGVGTERRLLLIGGCGQLFLGPDNGVFSPILKADPQAQVYQLTNRDWFLEEISTTFHGRDIMAPAAARLSLGAPIAEAGPVVPHHSCVILPTAQPSVSKLGLVGEVSSIDRFGNLITTIEAHHLEEFLGTSRFNIRIHTTDVELYHTGYANLPDQRPAAIINSSGLLEICVKNGSAADFLSVTRGEPVEVKRR